MKINKVTLGVIVTLLCLLLIGCSQTTATANPIVKPAPTQTLAPTLRCNTANVACFYQDEATGGPCYGKDANVLSSGFNWADVHEDLRFQGRTAVLHA